MYVTHGMTNHPLYKKWSGMKDRCLNKTNIGWNLYGGRGITVCDRWLESFQNFFDDMGDLWKEGLSIDRIDSNGNYEPSNCRWATDKEQGRNRRNNRYIDTIHGAMCVADAAEIAGIPYNSMMHRANIKIDSSDILNKEIVVRRRLPRDADGIKKTNNFVKDILLNLQDKGMSQSAIALQINTKQGCISKWMAGKNIPSGEFLVKLMALHKEKCC